MSVKKEKKSQISMFVIVAIVIVVIVLLVYFMVLRDSGGRADDEYFSQAHIKPQVTTIQTSILDCMNDISTNALDVIGIQGGYYNKPDNYFDLGWTFIPYYYDNGFVSRPIKSAVEGELELYVNDFLNSCVNDLSFDEFELIYKKPKTSVMIKSQEVEFKIDMPVNIVHDNKRIVLELSEFPVYQDSYLNEILEVAEYITLSHSDSEDMMCINCIADMAYDRDLYVDFLEFKEAETLVVISENMTRVEPYIFEFLNKYPVEVEA